MSAPTLRPEADAEQVIDASRPLTARQSARSSLPYLAGVLSLHLLALLLWVPASLHSPLVWGLGVTAYLFGLRHAWDADHIAVIDNTVRKLLTLRRPAYGVGLFFSLGHSFVVLLLAVLAAFIGKAIIGLQGQLSAVGGSVAAVVGGLYLLAVAAVNLTTAWRTWRAGPAAHPAGHHHGGLLARFIAPLTRLVSSQAQVLPLGFLMGLGFDTASEVALLALAGGAAQQGLSWYAVLSLPLLFASGMTLLDTLDGAAMTHAYGWSLNNPASKRTYNLLVTGLSGAVALVIGAVDLVQWGGGVFPSVAKASPALQTLDLSPLGFWLAGAVALLFAAALWRYRARVARSA